MTGNDPTLLAAMATSRETRVAVGVLVIVVVALLVIGSWSAGAAAATEARITSVENAIKTDRGVNQGRQDRDEWTRRDVLEQIAELKAEQQAAGRMLLELRDDVKAIRDAVAPLPRAKGGQ